MTFRMMYGIATNIARLIASENPIRNTPVRSASRLSVSGIQIPLTLSLLALLTGVFLMGFSEAISLAMFVAIPYIILNVIVLAVCTNLVLHHPELIPNWRSALALK